MYVYRRKEHSAEDRSMMDTLIALTQSGMGQTIGLIGFLVFPLFAAIYGKHLNESGNKSTIITILLIVLYAAGAIIAIDDSSFVKTFFRGIFYSFVMVIITGFYMDLMESK